MKKEAEKAIKLARFEEKQRKLKEQATSAVSKSKKSAHFEYVGRKNVSQVSKRQAVSGALEYIDNYEANVMKDGRRELHKVYDPGYVEAKWCGWWEKEGFFKPEYGRGTSLWVARTQNPKGTFIICIPPPNVTGTLHVGHALATTVEDTLTRCCNFMNRMKGKTTLFNPGCDHAGIATQVVVEKKLERERGLSRHDLGRDRFIDEVWKWKNEKGCVIYDQLRRMGASVDWDRACFMMDPKIIRAVTEAFIRMHERGIIYRSNRLVNWSCALRSAISDIEVDKKELHGRTLLAVPGYDEKIEFGVLISFAYSIKGENEEIIVSTTRIETMLGDTAVAVHPDDPRYQRLIGKTCIHPFVDRELPIIADYFVDREFGTGAVKITPAHDYNDYEFVTCIDGDGLISSGCGKFSSMRRFDARAAIIVSLKELGMYRGSQDNAMVVPICSRSKDIVEPLLKAQWYVKCGEMAKRAITAVESGELKLIPDYHVATWNRWLQSSRDWCISRQLWWGHRIPAYFITFTDGKTPNGDPCDDRYWVSAHSEDIALQKAAIRFNVDRKFINLKWDEDVLDTWFSSGMWPFAIMGWPENTADMQLYFPSSVLETGHDILFFWVARMVFMSQELTGKLPFKEVVYIVFLRGITLAELNEQLRAGNLDAKELTIAQAGQARDYPKGIPECGADALRFALLAYTSQGRDINLDVLRVQGYRFFCNKVTTTLYDFWLYDLCDVYLEAVKPVFLSENNLVRKTAKDTLYNCVEAGLRLISPIMPFLSEELWQHLPRIHSHPPSIVVHSFPEVSDFPFRNEKIEADVSFAMNIIRTIRSLRSDYELTNKTKIDLFVCVNSNEDYERLIPLISLIETLTFSSKVQILLSPKTDSDIPPGCAHVIISSRCAVYIALQGIINLERELTKLTNKHNKLKESVTKLMDQEENPDYETKVPLPIRISNREKKESLLSEIRSIEGAIAALSC
ncbi:valine--tRNA ligase [Dictyocaulus viviparus]|uniref:Valine--tRNA ligase n=1 Tax=Dictyocaulus viviparus TaxID=29172 RepID=A0A0D8XWC9_DICVI|nr:valine--tRNA ligase [Dictyocaulus viviparus]